MSDYNFSLCVFVGVCSMYVSTFMRKVHWNIAASRLHACTHDVTNNNFVWFIYVMQARDDIQHVRFVLSESQKVLATVVVVLNALQEEVHTLGVIFNRQSQQKIELHQAATSSLPSSTVTRKTREGKGDKNRKMSESFENSTSIA